HYPCVSCRDHSPPTTYTLSLHDALPISSPPRIMQRHIKGRPVRCKIVIMKMMVCLRVIVRLVLVCKSVITTVNIQHLFGHPIPSLVSFLFSRKYRSLQMVLFAVVTCVHVK